MARPTPELRRDRIKRGSKRLRDLEGAAVTEEERALATEALAAFNATFGTRYALEAHLSLLLGRIFEHPELGAEEHRQIIAAVFREPWWSGRPGLAVIYGNASQFERSLESWRSPASRRPDKSSHDIYDSTTMEVEA